MSFVCVVIGIIYGLLYMLTHGNKEGAVFILGLIWFCMCMFAGACVDCIGVGFGIWLFTTAVFILPLAGCAANTETKEGRKKIQEQTERNEKYCRENWYYIKEQKKREKSKK